MSKFKMFFRDLKLYFVVSFIFELIQGIFRNTMLSQDLRGACDIGDDVISSLEKPGVILGKLDRRVLLGQSPSGSQSGIKNNLRLYISCAIS